LLKIKPTSIKKDSSRKSDGQSEGNYSFAFGNGVGDHQLGLDLLGNHLDVVEVGLVVNFPLPHAGERL